MFRPTSLAIITAMIERPKDPFKHSHGARQARHWGDVPVPTVMRLTTLK